MDDVFVIAKDCFFGMSDLRYIIGHSRYLAEILLKCRSIGAFPISEAEIKNKIRDLELNPSGAGNFILPLVFHKKSEKWKKRNHSPVVVFLTYDDDGNVKLRDANDFTADGDITVKPFGSRTNEKFFKNFGVKCSFRNFLAKFINKFFKNYGK